MEEEIKKEIIGKAGFPLYVDYWEKYFSQMSGEQVKECLKIIFHFNTTFEVLKSDDLAVNMVVITIIDNVKRDAKKRIKQSRASRGNGLLGGRPKKPDDKQDKSKTEGNVNDNVECKSELGMEMEMEIKNPKPKGFIKPTLQEIQDYCKERINGVNPSKFFDYYSASNWKDKDGKSVKNWKQKIISWESRNGGNETKQNNQTLCQEINKLAGGNLITKIEAAGKSAQLYFENEDSFQKLKKLETSIKDQIKKTIGDKLGTTELEFKF